MAEDVNSEQHLLEAENHMRAGRYDQAVSIYKKLVEDHPSEDSFLLQLAWAYHDAGALFEAIDCFEQLMEKELRQEIFTGFAYDELVRLFKSENLHDRLVVVCEKAVKAQPEDTGYLGDLAEAYVKVGSFLKAAQTYSRMIDIDPLEADFHCRLGNVLIRAGEISRAEDAYRQAAGMENADQGLVYYKLADAYTQVGLDEKAEAAQQKSLTFCGDNPLYHLNLSLILARQQKFHEAKRSCEQAIRLDPADRSVYYNRLGHTLLRAGFHEQAIETFSQAIKADPGNPFYYFYIAECYRILGRHDEADDYLKQSGTGRKDFKCGRPS